MSGPDSTQLIQIHHGCTNYFPGTTVATNAHLSSRLTRLKPRVKYEDESILCMSWKCYFPEKLNGPCYWAPFPQEVTIRSAVNGKRRVWWWLLLCSFSSLRPICYKFVDDETSKHVVWIAKGEITRHALFHGFPFAVKALKQAALQLGRSFHWPLLSSVTAIDSPIMTVCQRVFLPHKTRPVRADRSAHICSAPLKTLLSPAATGDYGNMSSLS